MNIVEIDLRDKFSFNQFVAKNNGSFLQSWEWGDWQETLGRKVYRLAISEIIDGNAETVASMQIIKMSLPFNKYYLYCPYGPVVNFKFQISNFKFLFEELKNKFNDVIFIRTEAKSSVWLPTTPVAEPINRHATGQANYPLLTKTKNIQPGKTLIVDLTKTESDLLAEMHHKTRYNIRLAEKHGVEIQDEFVLTVGKGIYAKEAIDLIAQTAVRQGYKAQNKDYFEKLASFFAVQNPKGDMRLHVYKALYHKELLASAIIIDFGKTRTYLFGGSSEQNKNIMAPYLLHFRAMLDAKALGLTGYDFWGIETSAGDTPGFVRFKLGFSESSDAVRQYSGAYDLVISPWHYKLYKLLRLVNRFLKRG